jgi:hypothetical protein
MNVMPAPRPDELVEIPYPFVEPRIAYQNLEPRKVNNLTLIDGKTFLSTTISGDITPAGAPDVGFFHDDTRFLSSLDLKVGGHRSVVLSSSTERSFASQIELSSCSPATSSSITSPLRISTWWMSMSPWSSHSKQTSLMSFRCAAWRGRSRGTTSAPS